MAKEYVARIEKKISVKEKMYYFSMDELKEVEKVVDSISAKRKAKNELV